MESYTVKDFNDFNNYLDKYIKSNLWIFRGQSNIDWELIPKAGRKIYSNYSDKKIIKSWKNRATVFLNKEPINDWDWLYLAQHHGVPTRLLDWSINPLIACYFAVNKDYNEDGVIYAIFSNSVRDTDASKPFDIKKISIVRPKSITPRITKQSGVFTIHPNATEKINKDTFSSIEKIIIPKEIKKNIMFKLNQFDINVSSLFPDLDGLARHICWHIENMEYWDSKFNI